MTISPDGDAFAVPRPRHLGRARGHPVAVFHRFWYEGGPWPRLGGLRCLATSDHSCLGPAAEMRKLARRCLVAVALCGLRHGLHYALRLQLSGQAVRRRSSPCRGGAAPGRVRAGRLEARDRSFPTRRCRSRAGTSLPCIAACFPLPPARTGSTASSLSSPASTPRSEAIDFSGFRPPRMALWAA